MQKEKTAAARNRNAKMVQELTKTIAAATEIVTAEMTEMIAMTARIILVEITAEMTEMTAVETIIETIAVETAGQERIVRSLTKLKPSREEETIPRRSRIKKRISLINWKENRWKNRQERNTINQNHKLWKLKLKKKYCQKAPL